MANKLHIKKDDQVKVLSGKDRGAKGRVLVVMPTEQKAIVEGVNLVKKHQKPTQQNPNGTIVEQEAAIHLSKLMLIDPKTGKPTRVGRTKTDKGWVRVSKKSGEIIK
jgi:large subunit ribosomal protein L24